MDSPLAVIKASIDDIDILSEVCRKTIIETYGEHNTKENLEDYISEAFSYTQLAKELNDLSITFFLASLGKDVIAYAKIKEDSTNQTSGEAKGIQLERLYILKKYQKKMIGAFLISSCIGFCKTKNCNFIWLGVWELNTRAIKFFTNWKFKAFTSKVFYWGTNKQRETLMKRVL